MYKVYGERNSGTNFITQLIKINFDLTLSQNEWKHAIPTSKTDSIDFIIVRELPLWLSSMYMNPYHMKRLDNFTSFLTLPQKMVDGGASMLDDNKTIFDIRYSKYKGMLKHFNTNKNVCIVKLGYIQTDTNCLHFLKSVNSVYKLNKKTPYITTIRHTKDKSNRKNREPKVNANNYLSIINANLNSAIEHEIESLTFIIKE